MKNPYSLPTLLSYSGKVSVPSKKPFQTKPIFPSLIQLREQRFRKKRNGNAAISAQFWIGDAWHEISLEADQAGLIKLRRLYEGDRKLILDSLLTSFSPSPRKELKQPRGRNTKQLLKAQFTARWLGPSLLRWAKECNRKDPLFLKALRHMSQEDYHDRTPIGVAAYLVERNWCNRYETWPSEAPTDRTVDFFKVLKRNAPSIEFLPKPIAAIVGDILDGEPYIITPPLSTR